MKPFLASKLLLPLCALSVLCGKISAPAADLTVTAANVLPSASAKFATGKAGVAITAGQWLYLDTDGTWKLADANDVTPKYKVRGCAVNSAGVGQYIRVCIGDTNFNPGATLSIGTVYILSTTPGGIAPVSDAASGSYISILGIATSTSLLKMNTSPYGTGVLRSDVAKP